MEPLNRIQARKQGLPTYLGSECDNCGRSNRRTANGACIYCKDQEFKYIRRNNEVLSMNWGIQSWTY